MAGRIRGVDDLRAEVRRRLGGKVRDLVDLCDALDERILASELAAAACRWEDRIRDAEGEGGARCNGDGS